MKLVMLQGLPGSGKTTYARELEARDFVRVNKDDIRADLKKIGWSWSPEREGDVISIRNQKITAALADGKSVVSDDTNFGRKHRVELAAIAVKFQAEFVVQKLDTPIEVCVERDAKRTGDSHVGEAVIRRMASQYNLYPAESDEAILDKMKKAPAENLSLNPALICDLDGTLAIHNGRSPYDAARCGEDALNEKVARLLLIYERQGYLILFCSGRDDTYRPETSAWLHDFGFKSTYLYMRSAGDKRKDFIVKYELFDKYIRPNFKVDFVLDDRDQVVRMWRHIGLTCFQVAPGAF